MFGSIFLRVTICPGSFLAVSPRYRRTPPQIESINSSTPSEPCACQEIAGLHSFDCVALSLVAIDSAPLSVDGTETRHVPAVCPTSRRAPLWSLLVRSGAVSWETRIKWVVVSDALNELVENLTSNRLPCVGCIRVWPREVLTQVHDPWSRCNHTASDHTNPLSAQAIKVIGTSHSIGRPAYPRRNIACASSTE